LLYAHATEFATTWARRGNWHGSERKVVLVTALAKDFPGLLISPVEAHLAAFATSLRSS